MCVFNNVSLLVVIDIFTVGLTRITRTFLKRIAIIATFLVLLFSSSLRVGIGLTVCAKWEMQLDANQGNNFCLVRLTVSAAAGPKVIKPSTGILFFFFFRKRYTHGLGRTVQPAQDGLPKHQMGR